MTLGLPAGAETLAPGEIASQRAESLPYRLVFTSSTTCQNPSEFVRQLHARSSRLRPATGLEPALTVLVDLAATPELVRGQLVIRARDGSLTVREVPGMDCQEVLSAMSLIAALELHDRPPIPPPPRPAEPNAVSVGLGARVTTTSGTFPETALGVSVFAEVAMRARGVLRPALRVAGHRSGDTAEAANAQASQPGEIASADFELWLARVSGCPIAWSPVERVVLRPCAFWEIGQLSARGYKVVNPEPERQVLWSAAGAELAAEVLAIGPLTLGAEAGVNIPFVRDSFYFDPEGPNAPLHRVASVGFVGGIGAGLVFF